MSTKQENNLTKIIKVPQLPWNGPKNLDLTFPNSWDIEVKNIAGYDRRAMKDADIRASILSPIGMPPIREYARGKKEVVIIFDDITRVTRVSKILPCLLEELAAAGIPEKRIRFVAALGTHGSMNRMDFAKKLGEDIMARFPVYNHNAHNQKLCTYVGKTSRGTEVYISEEVMSCDLKIAISTCSPHISVIFSGGGKLLMPGVSYIDSVRTNHAIPAGGDYNTNERRLDMEEIAKMAGLDIAIECIVNLWGETVAMFAGAETEAHEAAVEEARKNYLCAHAKEKDIVIANSYAKVMESAIGLKTSSSLSEKGGTLVLIANVPDGQVVHYFFDLCWGLTLAGKAEKKFPIPPNVDHLIVFTEYPEVMSLDWFHRDPDRPDRVVMMTDWNEVIRTLQGYHGDKANVVIYPNADIQYFSESTQSGATDPLK